MCNFAKLAKLDDWNEITTAYQVARLETVSAWHDAKFFSIPLICTPDMGFCFQ